MDRYIITPLEDIVVGYIDPPTIKKTVAQPPLPSNNMTTEPLKTETTSATNEPKTNTTDVVHVLHADNAIQNISMNTGVDQFEIIEYGQSQDNHSDANGLIRIARNQVSLLHTQLDDDDYFDITVQSFLDYYKSVRRLAGSRNW